jgi:hypothetical protein
MPITQSVFSSNIATSTTGVLATGNVNLRSLFATNANASERFLLIYNKATAPVSSDIPVIAFPIPAIQGSVPGQLYLDSKFFSDQGVSGFPLGLSWGVSGTETSFDSGATASQHCITLTGGSV